MSARGRRLAAAAAAVMAAAGPPTATAAAQSAPYLPLDDPAYHYVDALLARGALRSLTGLERPYAADALLSAAADTAELGSVGRAWARALASRARAALPVAPGGSAGITIAVGAELAASGSAQREVMLASRDAALRPALEAGAALALGRLTTVARWRADAALADDPDYGSRGNRGNWAGGSLPNRLQDGYLAARWRLGELAAGRVERDWGPPGAGGLQIGRAAFSYDHLYGRLGGDRLRLQTLLARLDDTPGLHAPLVRRYLAVHRLAGRWRDLEWAATESYVYSGAARRPSLALSNPLVPALVTHYLNDETGNVSMALDLRWRSPVGPLAAQLMVDDYQFERGNPGDDEPPSYALTLAAQGLPLAGEHRAFLSYTRVANLTYRTTDPGDVYQLHGVGLGRAFSDYDELRVGTGLALLPALPLRAYVAHRRQGSGDYRAPFPALEEYGTTPAFLAAPVSRVTRLAVAGGGAPRPGLGVEGDLGYNQVRGPGVVPGPDGWHTIARSGLAGSVRVRWIPARLGARW